MKPIIIVGHPKTTNQILKYVEAKYKISPPLVKDAENKPILWDLHKSLHLRRRSSVIIVKNYPSNSINDSHIKLFEDNLLVLSTTNAQHSCIDCKTIIIPQSRPLSQTILQKYATIVNCEIQLSFLPHITNTANAEVLDDFYNRKKTKSRAFINTYYKQTA